MTVLPAGSQTIPPPDLTALIPAAEVGSRPAAVLPPLTLGEVVAARVLSPLPEGLVLLDIKGVPLDAAAPPGLTTGVELTLRVVALEPQATFQILDSAPSIEAVAARVVRAGVADAPAGDALTPLLRTLRTNVAASFQLAGRSASGKLAATEIPDALGDVGRLRVALERLLPDDAPPTAERLAAQVRDGGLLYEAKLARTARDAPLDFARAADNDVKGLLLGALRDVEAAPPSPQGTGLAEALVRHLGHVETRQALHLLAQLHGEPIVLPLPFFVENEWKTAFLGIEPDDGGGGGDRSDGRSGHNLFFLLDLDGLGRTRVDAHVGPRAVRALFYLDRDEAVRRVAAEVGSLGKALRAAGYDEVLLDVRPSSELSAARRETIDALPRGLPRSTHLVNVRA